MSGLLPACLRRGSLSYDVEAQALSLLGQQMRIDVVRPGRVAGASVAGASVAGASVAGASVAGASVAGPYLAGLARHRRAWPELNSC